MGSGCPEPASLVYCSASLALLLSLTPSCCVWAGACVSMFVCACVMCALVYGRHCVCCARVDAIVCAHVWMCLQVQEPAHEEAAATQESPGVRATSLPTSPSMVAQSSIGSRHLSLSRHLSGHRSPTHPLKDMGASTRHIQERTQQSICTWLAPALLFFRFP